MALNRKIGRDAVTWIALGLVVASILIITTRHASATKPLIASKSSAQRATIHRTRSRPQKTSLRPAAPKTTPPTSSGTQLSTPPVTSISTTTTAVTTTTLAGTTASPILTGATLVYPNDIAVTYPLVISKGPLTARLTWEAGSELTLALTCGRLDLARRSSRGTIDLRVGRVSGRCELRIARTSMSGAAIPYSLALTYLALNAPGSK